MYLKWNRNSMQYMCLKIKLSTVETSYNFSICPKGKWLYKKINVISDQSLLLSGISGAWISHLYSRINSKTSQLKPGLATTMVVTRFSNSTWQIGRIFDRVRPFTAIIATTIIATTIILESTKISRSGIRPGRRSLPTLILTLFK